MRDKETSDLRRRMEALERSEEKHKILINTIPDIIFEIDVNGGFVFVSKAIKMLGYEPEELIGRHFKEIVHPEDFDLVSRDRVLSRHKGEVTGDAGAPKLFDERRTEARMTRNLEVRLALKGGPNAPKRYCYTEVSSSGKWDRPVQDERKAFLGSIGIIKDITERKKVEEELKRANLRLKELDELKSEFVSTVSHELRTPLATTKEDINLVLDVIPGKISEKQRKILNIARNNIDRLSRVIDELLDISKIEAGKMELKRELVDIRSLARQVVSSFEGTAKERGLKLSTHLPKKALNAYVDSDRIIQVFTNLVGNAMKFTKKGRIEISAQEKDGKIECVVADTGVGISREDLPKLFGKFQRFERTAGLGEKGAGLGLSIAKGIVEMHKGKIWVESEVKKGTKFIFSLPKK